MIARRNNVFTNMLIEDNIVLTFLMGTTTFLSKVLKFLHEVAWKYFQGGDAGNRTRDILVISQIC